MKELGWGQMAVKVAGEVLGFFAPRADEGRCGRERKRGMGPQDNGVDNTPRGRGGG